VDEKKLWFEGKLLCDILRMSRQIEVEYLYIRTRKELFASLNPPSDIPAHVRVITRQLTAAYLGSRARPPKEKELSGPGSQVFSPHTGTFLEQQVIMDIYV
jgi:hypothetical protein